MSKANNNKYRGKLESALKKLNDVATDIEAVTTEFELADQDADVLSSNVDSLTRKIKAAVRKKPETFEIQWGAEEDKSSKPKEEKSSVDSSNGHSSTFVASN
tara:strand:- start:4425 stop:4730 length:306 start_codon:yes stop_codon:yes gene_type:complete